MDKSKDDYIGGGNSGAVTVDIESINNRAGGPRHPLNTGNNSGFGLTDNELWRQHCIGGGGGEGGKEEWIKRLRLGRQNKETLYQPTMDINDYLKVIKVQEQIGRLLCIPGTHNKSGELEIFVLADFLNPKHSLADDWRDNAVKVYAGKETVMAEKPHKWLHQGKWIADFEAIVKSRLDNIEKTELDEDEHVKKILGSYT